MKYKIGNIVKIENENNAYVVLCSKIQSLNKDFLKENPKIRIKNVEKIAENNISTEKGFDYKISKIIDFREDLYILDEELINITENLLSQ